MINKKILFGIIMLSLICYMIWQYQSTNLKQTTNDLVGIQSEIDVYRNSNVADSRLANITLYYLDSKNNYVVEKRQVLAKNLIKDPASIMAQELFRGPKNSNLRTANPVGSKIKSVNVDNRKITIDLTEEFIKNQTKITAKQSVEQIVKTLTELKDIDEVQFLIDGKKVNEFYDFKDFDKGFTRI